MEGGCLLQGVSGPGAVWSRGCLVQGVGVVSGLGVSAQGGVCSQEGSLLQGWCLLWGGVCSRGSASVHAGIPHPPVSRHPPVNRMTDACENITLLQLRCLRPVEFTSNYQLQLWMHLLLKVKTLPDPYGECEDNSNTAVSECRLACVTRAVVEKCGCHDVYMKPLQNATCK